MNDVADRAAKQVDSGREDVVDVAIVGYGPVGQILAAMLGQRGHTVRVVERWPELYGRARAGHLDHEAMRIVQGIGAADRLVADAYRPPAYEFRNGDHEILMSMDWHGEGISGWATDYFTYQPDIEDAFTTQVSVLPNVAVTMGFEVTELVEHDTHVELTAVRFERGADRTRAKERETALVKARYVIGTDGANSFVRGALGVGLTDLGFDEKWAVYDITPFAPLPLPYNDAQVCDPARPRCLFKIGDRRQRFEFMLLPGDDEQRLAAEEGAWEMMSMFGISPEHGTLERAAVYQFRSLIAANWREGRVVLAGDAAHLMPPFLGQGLISGLRDAASLEWRLDLVLRGRATDELLDTYQLEREPHVTEIIRQSVAAGEIACVTDPDIARVRDEAFKSGQVPPPPPFPTLEGGVLADPADVLTGTLAPQAGIARDGGVRRFDDVHGGGWVLLVSPGASASLDNRAETFLRGLGGQMVSMSVEEDAQGQYARFFSDHAIAAILYRPDFRIFGAAADVGDVSALVHRLQDRITQAGYRNTSMPAPAGARGDQ